MCGIVGYLGNGKGRDPVETVLHGLRNLEYRGYDSAGISFFNGSPLPETVKIVGKIKTLEEALEKNPVTSSFATAIGHTRWATHGVPSEVNAHPHLDQKKEIAVVHNGIIENYEELRTSLEAEGYHFLSATDTEVIPHLIARELDRGTRSITAATEAALSLMRGSYAIVVLWARDPQTLLAARRGSPILIGVSAGEYIIASDASAIAEYTKQVVYLDDGELAVLTPHGYKIFKNGVAVEKMIEEITWSVEETKKGGFPHFMLKEIHEGPEVISRALAGRVTDGKKLYLPEFDRLHDRLKDIDRIIITACGTSSYAALVGKYLIETFARMPVEVIYASEFRYHPPILDKRVLTIAVSQSGETADTLEAIREAKRRGSLTAGIVNVVGSTIAREVTVPLFNNAGPEIAVASTKAFLSQMTILSLIALDLSARRQTLSPEAIDEKMKELIGLPHKARQMLKKENHIRDIANVYATASNFMFIGRKFNWATALEGALKLKEISYIHAEGYPAGELKHGPIALIDATTPSVAIALRDSVYSKMLSNIEEIRSRRGPVLALISEGDTDIMSHVDHAIEVPPVSECFSPLLAVIPLQLLAYHIAVLRGTDVDQPRNLAKSVTVE